MYSEKKFKKYFKSNQLLHQSDDFIAFITVWVVSQIEKGPLLIEESCSIKIFPVLF